MPRVFHLLPETEPFCDYTGDGLARWVANFLQGEPDAVVLTVADDGSLSRSVKQVRVVPGLLAFRTFNEVGGHLLPRLTRSMLARKVFASALQDLDADDILWVHDGPEVALALAPLVRSRGGKVFLHLHDTQLNHTSQQLINSLAADCTIFESSFLEHQSRLRFPLLGRTEVLSTGIDCQAFHKLESTIPGNATPMVIFSARLVRETDAHVFLDAMRILQAKQVALKAVVIENVTAAEGVTTPYLREMRRNAPSNVRFEPFTNSAELGDLMRTADIFCMPPSWHEPLSRVMLEAMACGLPVIAAESNGIPEALAERGGLLLVRNQPGPLAEALALLATDHGSRKHLAYQAYQTYATSFMWSALRETYKRIIQSPVNSVDLSVDESKPRPVTNLHQQPIFAAAHATSV